MSTVIAAPAAAPTDPTRRRLAAGLLVSLLLHALVLSLQFGIPGLRPGPGRPLTVHLAAPPASPAPESAPLAVPDALPAMPAQPVAPALPVPPARQGFALLDPARPQPAPAPPAIQPRRRKRVRVRAPAIRDGLHTEVIAQDAHKADSFSVPPAAGEPAPDVDPGVTTADAQARQPDAPPAAPEQQAAADPSTQAQLALGPAAPEQQAERERLAAQREQERAARREAEEQALQAATDAEARRAADQQARALAQENARYEDELASRQRQVDEARRRADEALARSREEEQRLAAARIQAEQERGQQLAEQRQGLAQAQQAEQLARERAEQAERLVRQEQARRQPGGGIEASGPARTGTADNSGFDGVGSGAGTLPRTALDSPLASRARELLRGIDLDKPVPQAVRAAEDARRKLRRALADAVLHDVPLRMYIDSIRQKIERNAILSPGQLAADAVRIFPIVSIVVRSDGSVDDVTIVRSSGRADIDEVVRHIVRLNARYAAFPPNVAAHYDVVELRRIWSFAGALRLLEEMR